MKNKIKLSIEKNREKVSKFLVRKLFYIYIISFLLITSTQLLFEYKSSKKELVGHLNNLAVNFAPGMESALWEYRLDLLDSILTGVSKDPLVVKVSIYDNNKRIQRERIDENEQKMVPDLEIQRKLVKNVKGKSSYLGTLTISSSSSFIFKKLITKGIDILLLNIFILFTLISIIWIFTQKYITKPLSELLNELSYISIQGDMPLLDTKNIGIKEIFDLKNITNLLIQEIFVMKDSTNVIVQELMETQEELEEKNHFLEEEIQRRMKEIIQKEMRFRSIFEQANAGLFFVDAEGKFIDLNDSYAKLLGYTEEELLGKNFRSFTYNDDISKQSEAIDKMLKGEIDRYRIEKRYINRSSQEVWVDLAVTALKNDNNEVVNLVGLAIDISERKKSEAELKHLYSLALDSNALTGLPGNNSIRKRIEQALENNENVFGIYADLDNFKAYNDNYGFAMGDKMIKHVADIFHESAVQLNLDDFFLGHIGGDDFVMLVSAEKAYQYADEVIKNMNYTIGTFYSEKDFSAGYINAYNRNGEAQKFPLVSVSLAALEFSKNNFRSYLEINDAFSTAKKQAKKIYGNCFYVENRAYK